MQHVIHAISEIVGQVQPSLGGTLNLTQRFSQSASFDKSYKIDKLIKDKLKEKIGFCFNNIYNIIHCKMITLYIIILKLIK